MRGCQPRVERLVVPNSRYSRSSSLGHSVIARHGITGNVKVTTGPCLPITDTGTSDKSLGRMIHRTRLFSTEVASF